MAISGADQIQSRFPNDMVFSMMVHQFFNKYSEGFYVHMPEESRITNKRKIAKYLARYIRHPAVANTRLYKYDGKSVTFWYKDDKGIYQHIPDKNFKMIRYYGAYSRKTKKIYSGYLQRSLIQTTLYNFTKNPNKWAPNCPRCDN